jgi:DNA polymerase
MPKIFRDIETCSAARLGNKGVPAWRYATDPTTRVHCVAFAVDDGPTQIWIPGQPVPPEFSEAARNPDWWVVAHNDEFETAYVAMGCSRRPSRDRRR